MIMRDLFRAFTCIRHSTTEIFVPTARDVDVDAGSSELSVDGDGDGNGSNTGAVLDFDGGGTVVTSVLAWTGTDGSRELGAEFSA